MRNKENIIKYLNATKERLKELNSILSEMCYDHIHPLFKANKYNEAAIEAESFLGDNLTIKLSSKDLLEDLRVKRLNQLSDQK